MNNFLSKDIYYEFIRSPLTFEKKKILHASHRSYERYATGYRRLTERSEKVIVTQERSETGGVRVRRKMEKERQAGLFR